MIKVRYFAWLRERIGTSSEEVEFDGSSVAELIERLKDRSESHAFVFEDLSAIRVAVDEELVEFSAAVGTAREVAFFPPMTGG